jgi:hypothetical protein
MPWVQIQKSTEATWEDYEKVQRVLGDDAPEGLLYHAAGEIEGGRWQAVSVWESQEHFDRFRDERLMPAVQEALPASLAEGGPPPTEWFETRHVMKR